MLQKRLRCGRLWVFTLRRVAVLFRRPERTQCLNLLCERVTSGRILQHSTQKMEAVRSSETSKSNTLLGVKGQNVITGTFRLGHGIWRLNQSSEF